MSRLTWTGFRTPAIRIASLTLVSILLIGSFIGVWKTFSAPAEEEEQVTRLTYRHSGEFDHQAYAKPVIGPGPGEESKAVYFTKIIESMNAFFSYRFVSPEPLIDVREEVEISAILGAEQLWQYELVLVPKTTKTGDFTMTFPLDSSRFDEVANRIRAEIGTGTMSSDVTFKATVHTVAQTDSGVLEDDFVQTAKVKFTSVTVEWDKDLAQSQWVMFDGLRYEHQGMFDYKIKLKPNILFGPVTIESNTPLPKPPVAMAPSDSYAITDLAYMDSTFSYQFASDHPLLNVSTGVEVTAVLQDPEHWSETFVLVPESEKTEHLTIAFPLDLAHYKKIIDAKQSELGVYAQSHELVLRAKVHSVAETEFGPIDEVFTQSVNVDLRANAVRWPGETKLALDGRLTETRTMANSVWPARGGAIVALGLVVLFGYFVARNLVQVKPTRLTPVEAEARRVKKKHKDVIVDVVDLPQFVAEEMVTSVRSLEELANIADTLFKLVLHKAEPGKHIYRVIDGVTAYEYVVRDQGVREETEETDLGDESN